MTPSTAARMEQAYDTEITLGTGKMLALFFGLVILCAVFFGVGFSMGRNSAKIAPELLPSPSETSRPAANRNLAASAPATSAPPASAVQSPTPADNTAPANAAQPVAPADQAASDQSQPNAGYYLQVAAVSKQEDAEALVESLKGHQYQAFIANQPSDKLFHVQVGPFSDVKDAETMRTKLVNDGYNPILKK